MAYDRGMEFQWDEAKDRSNQKKHGLSFTEAIEVFESDQEYLEIFDSAHSDTEDRFLAIGEIRRGIAVVVFTEREDAIVRIIGARFATAKEQEMFHTHMSQWS